MTAKLTLSINKNIIERAKVISKHRGKSLSKIVEEHLKAIGEREINKKPSVKSLSGILKNISPPTIDLKKEKGVYLKNKYAL